MKTVLAALSVLALISTVLFYNPGVNLMPTAGDPSPDSPGEAPISILPVDPPEEDESDSEVPTAVNPLDESQKAVNLKAVSKVITLEAANTVTLRGPVTGSSVGKAMRELRSLSQKLPESTPIFLVLDTPGGSVTDGMDLIEFVKALPQKTHTVTLFAASMGFQIAQNLQTRYITTNGMLMSHRAAVRGLGGQVKGELESRYKMIRRSVDLLDFVAAKRMGLPMAKYEEMVVNELWIYGFDSLDMRAADEVVLLRCGRSMTGSEIVEFDTFFGPAKAAFSKCPLIKEPQAVDLKEIKQEHLNDVRSAINMALRDQARFVNEYVTTSRIFEVFR